MTAAQRSDREPSPDGLATRLLARLSEREAAVVLAARGWSVAHGAPLYVVGGAVRDLLLDVAGIDADLALDGDVAALATDLATLFQARATFYDTFLTATVQGDGWSVDIARTRSERYAAPGMLPAVEPAPIERDLERRDFSVNALALVLSESGELLDPLGGMADLTQRRLRALHRDSFIDDPTRIIRLARYAARLDFSIEHVTAQLARRATPFLEAVTPARIWHELARTFGEAQPERAIDVLEELGALRYTLPKLTFATSEAAAFVRLRADGGPQARAADYLATLAALHPSVASRWHDRLAAPAEVLHALQEAPRVARLIENTSTLHAPPDEVVALLAPFSMPATRGAAAALGGRAAALEARYRLEWAGVRPQLRGDHLLSLGVPAGPPVGEVLRLLLQGRLRGTLTSANAERTAVLNWLSQHQPQQQSPEDAP